LTATGERTKEALEKLNAKEEQFAFIASNVLDIIAYMDRVGNYMYVSPSCCYVLGYSLEDFEAIAGYIINHPEDVSRVKGVFANAIKQKRTCLRYETRLRHKGGHYIPFEVFGKIFYDSDGDYSGFLLTGRDITERRKAEENNEKLQAQLAQAQKMESVGRLAGGVAHDLNNVLSGIVSYPELILLNLPEDSKLREPLKTMMESGLRAAAIVQDLLTMARGVATANEPLNLNDLISEYLSSPECDMLKQHHPAITIKTDLDPSLLNIGGSLVHVRKVIVNLVVNAVEAIKESGNITISTANRYIDRPSQDYHEISQGEYAVLSVADDGHGITPDDLERIFEPFYTKKKLGRSGSGLGLAVVWNVMQDHKGYIDVTTGENGTIFELYFPITRDAVLIKELPLSINAYKGNGEKILFVDDEKSQREISCKILEKLGYKATSVASGEEAVEYLKKNAADLVVLDMIMDPGISGHETYKQIIQIHPAQKAIIVSGFSETDDVKDTQMLGAGKYIKKPLTIERLGIAVKEELEK
jgi:two-component system, cell cycle sensor histidine kinase and response regulator CckA